MAGFLFTLTTGRTRALAGLLAPFVCLGQDYIISTFAGATVKPTGPATNWSLAEPTGVAIDAAGNIFVSSAAKKQIWKIDGTDGTILQVFGTSYQHSPSGDGGPAELAGSRGLKD
jgi:hypothetical protein